MEYIALLRGVNVGGRIIRSAELAACFERLGFTGVKTVLQSGNAVFESRESNAGKLKQEIEAGLSEAFGYPAKAQIVSAVKLRQIIADYPFTAAGPSEHDYVIFVENGLEKGLAAEPRELMPGEKVRPGRGVIYWRVAKGQTLQTDFAKLLTKAKYKNFTTTRNLNTLKKLAARN